MSTWSSSPHMLSPRMTTVVSVYHRSRLLHLWMKYLRADRTSGFFLDHSFGKESACSAGDLDSIPGLEHPLEKEMATHSSILVWKIPWTQEPGRLQSVGSQESDTTERLSTHTRHGLYLCLG